MKISQTELYMLGSLGLFVSLMANQFTMNGIISKAVEIPIIIPGLLLNVVCTYIYHKRRKEVLNTLDPHSNKIALIAFFVLMGINLLVVAFAIFQN